MRQLYLVVALVVTPVMSQLKLQQQTCDANQRFVDVQTANANVLLGGMFSIHKASSDGFGCGVPRTDFMQAYEAARWTINQINNNNNGFISGVRFGMKAYDTCSQDGNALAAVEDFYPELLATEASCNKSNTGPYQLGMIGPMLSGESQAAGEMLARVPASTITMAATSPSLSNTNLYPTLMRTTQPVSIFARALTKLFDSIDWKRIVVVYVDDMDGSAGYQEILRAAADADICINAAIPVASGSQIPDLQDKLRGIASSGATAAVFYGSSDDARLTMQALQNLLGGIPAIRNMKWLFSNLEMDEDYSQFTAAQGSLVASIAVTDISSFRSHFVNLNVISAPAENPWLRDWYMQKYQCNLGVAYAPYNGMTNCQTKYPTNPRANSFRQSPLVERTIFAIYAYAQAIKSACNSPTPSTSICATLRNSDPMTFHSSYLSLVNFTFPSSFVIPELRNRQVNFDVNGDIMTSDYTFYNYNNVGTGGFTFKQFGTYSEGVFQTTSTITISRSGSAPLPVASTCPSVGCTGCLHPMQGLVYVYQPGDFVVAALVEAHEPGTQGMTCGDPIPDRLIEAVAARYVAEESLGLASRKLSIGYLIVDVCPGLQNAQSFLTNLLGGYRLYSDESNNVISAANIVAVLDMTREETAWQIAPVLAGQNIPQIRVAASSPRLLQDRRYPLLVSAVPSRETRQLAITQLLAALSWNYVQIVSESQGSSYWAAEEFRMLASRHGVCVALWSTFDMNNQDLVTSMRQVQDAPVVVVFGGGQRLRGLLQAVRSITAPANVQRRLTFIAGSDELGPSLSVVGAFAAEAGGMLTLQLAQQSNSNFNTWLASLKLSEISNYRFLSTWLESQRQCSLSASSQSMYDSVCPSLTNIPSNSAYQAYSAYVIQSFLNVETIMNRQCTALPSGVCSNLRQMVGLGATIVSEFNKLNASFEQDLLFFNLRSGQFQNVVRFDTNLLRLADSSTWNSASIQTATGTANSLQTQCTGRCLQCQDAYAFQEYAFLPGDFLVAGLFSVRDPGPASQQPYVCGNVRTGSRAGFHYTAAMMYALQTINSGQGPVSLNNVTLGGLIFDHCNNEGRAYGTVSDIYSGLVEQRQAMMPNAGGRISREHILAWLTDNTRSTQEVAELLEPLEISLVSPSATSPSLLDNPSFFRTVQGDSTTAMAIVKLCKTLGFRFLQVVYEDSSYGEEGLNTMTKTARQEGLCVINSLRMGPGANVSQAVSTLAGQSSKVVVLYLGTDNMQVLLTEVARRPQEGLTLISPEPFTSTVTSIPSSNSLNLLSLRLQNPSLPAFTAFLNNRTAHTNNPFFARYFMALFRCNLDGYRTYATNCNNQVLTSSGTYSQSLYALSTINAVYSVAQALQMTLVQLCGENYSGRCAAFMQSDSVYTDFLANLKVVRFSDPTNRMFQFFEREGNVVYDVLRLTGSSYQTVGTYGGASLVLDNMAQLQTLYSNVQSDCIAGCPQCIYSGLNFSLTTGDIYLGGLFDVRSQGQGVFSCGAINQEHGFQLLEAFHFALQKVNSKKGIFANILKGVTLGGVGLDSCQSSIRTGYIVNNINNGLTQLIRDGKTINPETIDTYIGPYSSDASIYLSRILRDLKVPQISYAATSFSLRDQFFYPYFFRTVPADDKQVLGMLQYLDQTNNRYVQVLYTDDSYGQQGLAQFDLLRSQFDVCVAQRVVFPESGVVSEESSNDVVLRLLQKPVANTVVIFAGTSYIRAFLQAVERSQGAAGIFRFLGPTTWGDRESVTEGIRGVANDAVTFVLDFEGSVAGFLREYLTLRNPSNAKNNPWFDEWFQDVLQCHTSPSNAARYPRACATNANLDTKVIEDNGVLHVINAVYAAAFAIHATLQQQCGTNYGAVCEGYKNSNMRRTLIRDHLENVSFMDPTNTEFRFVNRTGNKGYQLYRLTSSPTEVEEVVYNRQRIGQFDKNDVLSLNMNLIPRYNGSCDRKDACVECPTIRNRGVRYAWGGDPNGDVTLVGVFDVHRQGTELYQCGELNMEGFKQFLTFFWTYEQIAANNNIRLLALDTCSNSMRAGQDLYSLMKDGTLCNSEYFPQDGLGKGRVGSVVVGGKENAVAASRVLEPLRVTYLSADSVSPLMDDFQYLLRSRMPWSGFARLLSQLLKDNGLTYVHSIYVDSGMTREQYRAFQEMASASQVCLTAGLALPEDASDSDIQAALQRLDSAAGARVVVLFGEVDLILRILRVAEELGVSDKFFWVLAVDDPELLDHIPAGLSFKALIMRPVVPQWDDFQEFVQKIRYVTSDNNNNAGIPRVWWQDFYQMVHKCRLSDAVYPLMEYTTMCSRNLTVPDNYFNHKKLVHYTHLASLLSMDGLKDFYSDCQGGTSVEVCLSNKLSSRQLIRDTILNTRAVSGTNVYQFYKPGRYVEGDYNFHIVTVDDGEITSEELHRQYRLGVFAPEAKALDTESSCQRVDGCGCPGTNPDTLQLLGQDMPTEPRNFLKYDDDGDLVYEWPIWAIVVGVLTCLGLLVTIIVFLVLLITYPVRSGTSVLGYLTILGILGVYAINFAFFLHASDATCGARRFLMGVVYTIVFAPLLLKAVDNWRFADDEYGNHEYRGLTNACTLFLMAVGIVLVQCIIPIMWLIMVHPTASLATTSPFHDYWWCDPHQDYDIGLVLSFIFVMFLVLLTAIFAALAWDSESNNRESRWILVAAIATAGCFLVWMIVTTNAGPYYRDPAVAIANLVNASLLLILIPLRKLHLMCQARNEKQQVFGEYDPYANVYANQTFDPDADEYPYENPSKTEDGFVGE